MTLPYTGFLTGVKNIAKSLPYGSGKFFNAILSYYTASSTALVTDALGNIVPSTNEILVELRCKLYAVQPPAGVRYNNLPGSDQRRMYYEGHLVIPLEYNLPLERVTMGMDAIINDIKGKFYPSQWAKFSEHFVTNTDKSVGQPIAGFFEILNY